MTRHSPRMPPGPRPRRRLAALAAPLLALLLALSAPPPPARAGAWPQPEDGGFVTMPLAPSYARIQGFDRRGQPAGFGSQRALEIGPYWEHGLTSRWTVGLQPRLSAIWMNEPGNHNSKFGLAEVQTFLRYNLYLDDRNSVSVQGGFASPGIAQRASNPSLAEPNPTYELRLLYGRGIPIAPGLNGFFDTQVAYRYRAGPAADVLFLKNTLGVRPFEEWVFWVQSITDLGMRNGRGFGADYSAQRLTLSAVWDFTARSSVEFTLTREMATRHVPRGQGAVIAYWYRY